jgi:hypothetical protein
MIHEADRTVSTDPGERTARTTSRDGVPSLRGPSRGRCQVTSREVAASSDKKLRGEPNQTRRSLISSAIRFPGRRSSPDSTS